MKQNYIEYRLDGQSAYVLADKTSEIKRVDVIIFDCDGVLIDISESYIKAVAQTTCTLVEAFTGELLPESIFDGELNSAYKSRGGFNNDWSLVYALVMRILAESLEAEIINNLALESLKYSNLHSRYTFIKENRVKAKIDSTGLHSKLIEFSMLLDETGIESVDANLLPELEGVKRALNHPGSVGESMISTMFEEFFLGATLFEDTFQAPAMFNESQTGYVENEKIVITDKTLDKLEALIGGPRFGIASGSLANTARYVLENILNRFHPGTQVWHEDVSEAEKTTGQSLHKPSPYSLLRASEQYKPYHRVLYVGDTIADKLMVENAGEDFLFAGVFGSAPSKKLTMNALLEASSAMVIPSINQLPTQLELIKKEKQQRPL